MAATTLNPPLGWHLVSEGNGTYSRETVTIASGEGVLNAGAVLGKIVLLVAIILFIQKRPQGLFALKGREA